MTFKTIENWGYFVYIYVWMYLCHFCTLNLAFCVSSEVDPISNFTIQNPLAYQSLPVLS